MSNYDEDSVKEIVQQIGSKASFSEIIHNLHSEWTFLFLAKLPMRLRSSPRHN